jgi:Tol biopolymer transport system component/DNA-binding winged helix-turn-helix (wHTH) protein
MPSAGPIDETQLRFEGFTIDLHRRGLFRGAERIQLTPTPFKALAYLAQNPGRVVSKEQLLDAVWGEQRDENTVEQAIRQIRRALGDEKENPRFIQTISGEGYRFIAITQEKDEADFEQAVPGLAEPVTQAPLTGAKSYWSSRNIVVTSTVIACCLLFTALVLRQNPPSLTVANPIKVSRSQTRILSPLMTDGTQIFYPRYDNGRYSVASVQTEGGDSSLVVTGITNPELCDLAPDGQKMLLRDLVHSRDESNPLYIQPRAGRAQRVGNILAYDAAWYPDSRRILFSADGAVYATDPDGRFRKQLFSVPGNVFWFRWSPDGKNLRFTVIDKKSEETSIWEVGADGKAPHRLFSELHYHLCCGSWTPDGRFFLFQVRVENTFQIWAERDQDSYLLSARKRPFPLAFGAMSYRGPLASKDGRKLFVRAEAPKGELVQYDSRIRQFVPILPSISARTLAYSSDQQWIAYTSLADNNLWRCRADGTHCLQLTKDFKNTVIPRWSPDRQTIAFMGLTFTGKWGVFAVPATGGTILPISHDDQAKGYPDWSRDGKRLAFSDVPPVSQPGGIYILDLRSQKISTLPESTAYFFPRWSPDGRFLLAQHSGDLYLHLLDFSSGKWRPLTEIPAFYPSWSRDGKYIFFRSGTADGPAIFRVALADRTVEKVTSLAGVERGPFFMGDWIGLGPDDSPLAVRNSTIEDIYAWDLIAR